jgi:hypothetical protein
LNLLTFWKVYPLTEKHAVISLASNSRTIDLILLFEALSLLCIVRLKSKLQKRENFG